MLGRAVFALVISLSFVAAANAQTISIEFGDFDAPKRLGVDPFVLGEDTLTVGFDLLSDGTPVNHGTVITTAFEDIGLVFSAELTRGPFAGESTELQALDGADAPNVGWSASISPPNVLSAVDPSLGLGWSGQVAGSATLTITFLAPSGQPGTVAMVGAFNDLLFGANLMTAFAGPNGTGDVLGSVSATGAGDFFGLSSAEGIGSVTFTGTSTEVDDLTFTPVVPEPSTGPLLVAGFMAIRRRR